MHPVNPAEHTRDTHSIDYRPNVGGGHGITSLFHILQTPAHRGRECLSRAKKLRQIDYRWVSHTERGEGVAGYRAGEADEILLGSDNGLHTLLRIKGGLIESMSKPRVLGTDGPISILKGYQQTPGGRQVLQTHPDHIFRLLDRQAGRQRSHHPRVLQIQFPVRQFHQAVG